MARQHNESSQTPAFTFVFNQDTYFNKPFNARQNVCHMFGSIHHSLTVENHTTTITNTTILQRISGSGITPEKRARALDRARGGGQGGAGAEVCYPLIRH